MARLRGLISLVFVLLLGPLPALAGGKAELTLGVFPYVSPAQLVAFHTPLKDHLAKALQRRVSLVTAPDFDSFIERTRQGQYDIIITAPHLGRLAETRDGYQRLAQAGTIQGIFLTRKDSGIYRLADLRGKTVMIAQRVSLLYQMAEQQLRKNGLVPGESVTILETRTHNNAMLAPLRGEADVSVTGALLWRVLGEEKKGQMRVIGVTDEAPGIVLMANPQLASEDVRMIRKILLEYHKTAGGAAYFATTGFEKFQEIDDKLMKTLDPYMGILMSPAKS